MSIKDELLALTDTADGMIHAGQVVSWAQRNTDSELHPQFEWDDSKAAHEHRLNQARRLIAIHVVFEPTGKRAVVSLIPDRVHGGGYRPLPPILSNREMRSMLVRQILDEATRVLDRYPQLNELSPLRNAIETQRRLLEMAEQPLAAD